MFLFDIMRNSLKAVIVKHTFCMRLFIVKNEGPSDFVRYNEDFVKNHAL